MMFRGAGQQQPQISKETAPVNWFQYLISFRPNNVAFNLLLQGRPQKCLHALFLSSPSGPHYSRLYTTSNVDMKRKTLNTNCGNVD